MSETSSAASDGSLPWRVAVTGASGLIGGALVRRLAAEGAQVHRLVRGEPKPGSGDVRWDPAAGTIDAAALEGVDAVVHLAGENVGERWTEERKQRILRSRVEGTRLLTQALAQLERKPRVMVGASAVGIYGDRGDELLDEGSTAGSDFLAGVVREWEAAAEPARGAGIRVAHLRFGVVLSASGGALAKMLPPFRLGAGGRMGDGKQWMAWVSLDDAVGAILLALRDGAVRGPVNVVAPNPVTNAQFTEALGRALGRPTLLAVPAFALKALFGEMAEGTVLASQRVIPQRLTELGYTFRHPDISTALQAALAETPG
ncbi:MAG TPA: TIGR01777 family oxidoreductase [Longimicrobiaceae bacterium]|jgi:uncharacterized protein (TIGR01777 family)|nr:TIGR01777 family oxidoreductase [Longimicrobiaceae bacterium]